MENIDDYMPLSTDLYKERLAALKSSFPDLFDAEGNLNIEELKKMIDPKSFYETERYEFRWFGKSQAKRNAFTPTNATLIFDEERSVNTTETENLIIEGENLEVLKLLSNSYREKVKCIYIDPPYNTGKDFVYSDNYNEDKKPYWEQTGVTENGVKVDTNVETEGRFHSNWLDMMFSRLLIARTFLKPEGVIFISIDDHEVHNLRKLCDEVFGPDNFVGQIIWQTATDNNPTQIATEHEYVICYVKDINTQDFWEIPSEKGKIIQAKYEELKTDIGNDLDKIQTELRKWIHKQTNGDDLSGIAHYSYVDEKGVFYPGNSANTKPGGYTYDIIHPVTNKVCAKPEYGYRFKKETFDAADNNGDVMWGEDESLIPKIKKRLNTATQKLKSNYYEDNRATSQDLKSLMGGKKVFDNPKSVNFLKHVFRFVLGKDETILDFFGGAGSTGQAVLELNQEDTGNRRYILVQLPESTDLKSEAFKSGYKNISDITIERNKRVVERLIEEKKKQHPDLFTNDQKEDSIKGLGFKVFKLVKSIFPRVEWAPDSDKTTEENIITLKKYIQDKEAQLVTPFNRDDLMTEILLKNGFTLNYKLVKMDEIKKNDIYLATESEKETLICLDITIDMETVEYFKTNTEKRLICLERSLDTTKKWNLKHYLGDKFKAF